MTNNNPITISRLTIENLDGFIYPVLHIDYTRERDGETGSRYLMPFRLYRFQVCGTIDGEWDLGSSVVKMFKDILEYYPNPEWRLKCLLCECFNDYMDTSYGYPGRVVRFTFEDNMYRNKYMEEKDIRKGVTINNTETYKLEDIPFVDKFIEATVMAVKRQYKIA